MDNLVILSNKHCKTQTKADIQEETHHLLFYQYTPSRLTNPLFPLKQFPILYQIMNHLHLEQNQEWRTIFPPSQQIAQIFLFSLHAQ